MTDGPLVHTMQAWMAWNHLKTIQNENRILVDIKRKRASDHRVNTPHRHNFVAVSYYHNDFYAGIVWTRGETVQSAENDRIFPSFFRTSISLEFGLTPSGSFSLRLTFELSKLEIVAWRKSNQNRWHFSYGFPQTASCFHSVFKTHRHCIIILCNSHVEFCRPFFPHSQILCPHHFNFRSLYF